MAYQDTARIITNHLKYKRTLISNNHGEYIYNIETVP